ncbi:hypothetical protein CEXT_305981 [Caerostris extrusa]|uniref:Uncharacterized protein n=1 Tax=Caerostris extrusa TaxID=172846 RepID=A0AAV4N705_CAEEX|nr:hypothetical protein CEXT_305981 [Caerostris extrusa]
MPPKQISVPYKKGSVKEHQKRQENSQDESSEDGQVGRTNAGERTVRDAEGILERNSPNKLQCKTSKQGESSLQRIGERYEALKESETAEKREIGRKRIGARDYRSRAVEARLEKIRALMSQIVAAETDGYRERRLESRLLQQNIDRERETPAQWMARIEKWRMSNAQRENDKGDAIPVELDVVVNEIPTEFDPEPSASADIVTKDLLAVSDEEQTQSSTDVSPLSELLSHVTLSKARLESSQKPDQ